MGSGPPGDARGLGSNAARPGLGRGCRPQPGRATRPPGSQDKYLLCGPWTRSPGLLRKAAALAAALSLRSRRVSRPAASGRAGCAARLSARPAFSRGACTSATATWPPGPSGPSGPSGRSAALARVLRDVLLPLVSFFLCETGRNFRGKWVSLLFRHDYCAGLREGPRGIRETSLMSSKAT